jgi:hypothetical protein
MTNASASGAAVRRAREETSGQASAKANTKASAKTKTRF